MVLLIDMEMPKSCCECDFWSNVIGGYGTEIHYTIIGIQSLIV